MGLLRAVIGNIFATNVTMTATPFDSLIGIVNYSFEQQEMALEFRQADPGLRQRFLEIWRVSTIVFVDGGTA